MTPIELDVTVPPQDMSYPVRVGVGLLDRVGAEARRAAPEGRFAALVSDDNVTRLYGDRVRSALEAEGFEVVAQTVAAGERSKAPAVLVDLVAGCVTGGLGRRDVVIALGGGVVGDVAGLTAALFMRGVPFVQCPTSLLAQVDASVGGKVAVDLPSGKNLMGAFHFPASVLIDPGVLDTLPDDELGCGLAEMLKHGALFCAEHWAALLDQADAIYARDPAVLAPLVATSVALKAACVSRDPREVGGAGRVLLNLGHTVGHAIESASHFGVKHGQAVGLGLRAAARVSARRSLCGKDLEDRVTAALTRLRLPTDLDAWLVSDRATAVQRAIMRDKKRAADTVTYIGLADIGDPRVLPLGAGEILALLRRPVTGC